jgi:integrase
MGKANEEADPRRPRRALSEGEFQRLLEAARNAPLRPAGKDRSDSRRPAQRLSGSERADVYTILVHTGLRINELADVRVADVRLEGRIPGIDLPAVVDKRKKPGFIPLRADLVDLLRSRIEGLGLSPADRIFDVPADLIKRFDADCKRAGIPKRDERGRVVDIHALRMTYNTWLAKAGVHPRIAQELMRHSDIKLTTKVYTDPALFDLVTAVEALPMVHRMVHQTGVIGCQSESTDVNQGDDSESKKVAS